MSNSTFTWHDLQEALRNAETSQDVANIMKAEQNGPARLRWMKRIQGRFNTLRQAEEATHLESIAKE